MPMLSSPPLRSAVGALALPGRLTGAAAGLAAGTRLASGALDSSAQLPPPSPLGPCMRMSRAWAPVQTHSSSRQEAKRVMAAILGPGARTATANYSVDAPGGGMVAAP